ncbi:MAG: ATP synthase F1 subunit delta [Nitrospirae bacterium]|nr:ATP synthase F1 subunit delta [Nitrospirota bacterium]
MIKRSVARRYAKALFELLDAASLGATRTGLTGLADALTASSLLRHVLVSPAFGFEEKQAVLSALSRRLGCPPIVNDFLAQLVRKSRIGFLPEIADAFAALEDQAKGTQQVSVTSAKPLSPAQQQGLRTRLRDLLRRDVDLIFQTEPSLLSGLRIRIGSTVFDSTVRSRLAAVQTLLTKE